MPQLRPLMHPRHWLSWLAIGITWLLSKCPYRWQPPLGHWVGHLLRNTDKKSRHNTQTNLRLCFPSLTYTQRTLLEKRCFASLGHALLESAMAWWSSDKRLLPLGHFHGLDHLKHAQRAGQGVILVSAHWHGLELVGRLLSQQLPLCVTYRPQKNAILDFLIMHCRQRHYCHLIARHDIRGMLRALRQGHTVFYAADTDVHGKGCFAPFFDIPASTTIATARYAAQTGAQVIPLTFYRREQGDGYEIHIAPPLTNYPSANPTQDAQRINQLIEDATRQYPEQYLWQYRRFKTRPAQEPCFYDATPSRNI